MWANLACWRVLAPVLILALAASEARAQRGQEAGLSGTVTDQTGAVLAAVKLTVSSPQLIGGPRSPSPMRSGSTTSRCFHRAPTR